MDFTIKVYGFSTSVNGYKYEVIKDETNEVVHESVAATAEAADIAADDFLNQLITQPIIVRHRSIDVE